MAVESKSMSFSMSFTCLRNETCSVSHCLHIVLVLVVCVRCGSSKRAREEQELAAGPSRKRQRPPLTLALPVASFGTDTGSCVVARAAAALASASTSPASASASASTSPASAGAGQKENGRRRRELWEPEYAELTARAALAGGRAPQVQAAIAWERSVLPGRRAHSTSARRDEPRPEALRREARLRALTRAQCASPAAPRPNASCRRVCFVPAFTIHASRLGDSRGLRLADSWARWSSLHSCSRFLALPRFACFCLSSRFHHNLYRLLRLESFDLVSHDSWAEADIMLWHKLNVSTRINTHQSSLSQLCALTADWNPLTCFYYSCYGRFYFHHYPHNCSIHFFIRHKYSFICHLLQVERGPLCCPIPVQTIHKSKLNKNRSFRLKCAQDSAHIWFS